MRDRYDIKDLNPRRNPYSDPIEGQFKHKTLAERIEESGVELSFGPDIWEEEDIDYPEMME